MRYPVTTQAMRLVRTPAPQAAREIVDIGVRRWAGFVMRVFPDPHHNLFEPAAFYHADLEAD